MPFDELEPVKARPFSLNIAYDVATPKGRLKRHVLCMVRAPKDIVGAEVDLADALFAAAWGTESA